MRIVTMKIDKLLIIYKPPFAINSNTETKEYTLIKFGYLIIRNIRGMQEKFLFFFIVDRIF